MDGWSAIFGHLLQIKLMGTSHEIALRCGALCINFFFYLPDFPIEHFPDLLMSIKKENLVQIHYPIGSFYFTWAFGQWDMSSPEVNAT